MESKSLLKGLLKQNNETVVLEFKREIRLTDDRDKIEFAKDVTALANTRGGNIVFGKVDPGQGGQVVGIDPKSFDSAQMQQIISGRCYPPVRFEAELINYGKKSFVLLTVPNSPLKPHEIMSTRDVWVRRGEIVDKATDKERIAMRKENDGSRDFKVTNEAEVISEPHKDETVFMSIVVLFLMAFLPLRLGLFWILGNGLFNVSNIYTIYFVLIFVFAMIIGGVFFRDSFLNLLLVTIRKNAIPYSVGFALFVVIVFTINLEILLYPQTTAMFFQIHSLYTLRFAS